MKKIYFLIFCFFILIANLFPNIILQKYKSGDNLLKIETKISTTTLLGAVIPYEINLKYSKDILLDDLDLLGTLSNFEIKDFQEFPVKKNIFSKYLNRKYRFLLTKFDIGQFIINGLDIKYKLQDEELNYKLPDIVITISSLLELNKDKIKNKEIGFFDIKKIENIFPTTLFVILIFIVLLFLSVFIYYKFFYEKNIKSLQKNIPPHKRAFSRLNKISSLKFQDNLEIKNFYIELSEILREYIENRYDIEILDKTTMEVYKILLESKFNKKDARDLRDLMTEMDLVKFAKYIPENDIIKKHYDFVVNYIYNTQKIAEGLE